MRTRGGDAGRGRELRVGRSSAAAGRAHDQQHRKIQRSPAAAVFRHYGQ